MADWQCIITSWTRPTYTVTTNTTTSETSTMCAMAQIIQRLENKDEKVPRMQYIIGIYNHQHLKSHGIGNTLHLNYVKVSLQLPICVACWSTLLQNMLLYQLFLLLVKGWNYNDSFPDGMCNKRRIFQQYLCHNLSSCWECCWNMNYLGLLLGESLLFWLL